MLRLSVLGSTGQVGREVLAVALEHPASFRVAALAARGNVELLAHQAARFRPELLSVGTAEQARSLEERLGAIGIAAKVAHGEAGLEKAATLRGAQLVVNAIAGTAGIKPTMAALKARKRLALANTESMAVAGPAVAAEARRRKVAITPLDGRHSAVAQALEGRKASEVRRIMLFCRPSPLQGWQREQVAHLTAEQLQKHMGSGRLTVPEVRAASLSEAGLALFEAMSLFQLPAEKVDVLLHKEGVARAAVEFKDRSILLGAAPKGLRPAVRRALSPGLEAPAGERPVEFDEVRSLEFEQPDPEMFPCLRLAYEAGRIGKTMPAVYSAADAAACRAFLEGKLAFGEIPAVITRAMLAHELVEKPKLADFLAADSWACSHSSAFVAELGRRR